MLYEPAFAMGEWALTEMLNVIGEQLSEDEAGFMLLKFVCNDLSQQHPVNSVASTQSLANITKIISYVLGLNMNAKTPEYVRLVFYLKSFF